MPIELESAGEVLRLVCTPPVTYAEVIQAASGRSDQSPSCVSLCGAASDLDPKMMQVMWDHLVLGPRSWEVVSVDLDVGGNRIGVLPLLRIVLYTAIHTHRPQDSPLRRIRVNLRGDRGPTAFWPTRMLWRHLALASLELDLRDTNIDLTTLGAVTDLVFARPCPGVQLPALIRLDLREQGGVDRTDLEANLQALVPASRDGLSTLT